jgi:hypothetical protein
LVGSEDEIEQIQTMRGPSNDQIAPIVTSASLYNSLRKRHVLAYFNAQLDVLRTAARPRNFHRLEEIRDHSDNAMASVSAIKELEKGAVEAVNNPQAAQRMPGLVIYIVGGPPNGIPQPSRADAVIEQARPAPIDQE